MNLKEKVNELKDELTRELLAGEYQLVEMGEYTSILKNGNDSLEIWTANGAEGCGIYSNHLGLEMPKFETEEIKEAIFKLATTPTLLMLSIKLDKAKEEKNVALDLYKKSKTKITNILKEIEEFKKNGNK